MKQDIRIGLIGAGHIAGSHAAHWQREAVITAVCSRRRSSAERLAEQYDIPTVCNDENELLNRNDVDAVCISTPHHLHYPQAMAAMAAGKHVFCEKPLAMNGSEARDMYEKAIETGVKTGLQSGMRGFSALIELNDRLADVAQNGEIYNFHGTWSFDWARDHNFPCVWRFKRDEAGTGALADLGVYMIDTARWLVGDISEVCCSLETMIKERPLPADNRHFGVMRRDLKSGILPMSTHKSAVENDDICDILLKFENGTTGSIKCSRLYKEHEIRINCERISYYWQLDEDLLHGRTQEDEFEVSVRRSDATGKKSVVTDFLNDIRNDTNSAPSFYDGFKIQLVIDAALKADHEKKWCRVEKD